MTKGARNDGSAVMLNNVIPGSDPGHTGLRPGIDSASLRVARNDESECFLEVLYNQRITSVR